MTSLQIYSNIDRIPKCLSIFCRGQEKIVAQRSDKDMLVVDLKNNPTYVVPMVGCQVKKKPHPVLSAQERPARSAYSTL
jgi:hypothetical protein